MSHYQAGKIRKVNGRYEWDIYGPTTQIHCTSTKELPEIEASITKTLKRLNGDIPRGLNNLSKRGRKK